MVALRALTADKIKKNAKGRPLTRQGEQSRKAKREIE